MGNFVDMKLLLVVFAVATVAFGAESAPKAQKTLNAFEKTLSSGKANVTVNDVDAMLAKMAEKKQEHHKVLHTHKVHVAKKSKVPPPPSLKKSDHSKKSHHKASKSSKSHSMKSAPHGHSEDSDLDLQNPWYQEYLDNMGHYFVMGSIFVVILGGACAALNAVLLFVTTCARMELTWSVLSKEPLSMALIRTQIARTIVLSLDLLVCSEILDTLAQPLGKQTFEMLGMSAIIVGLRTVLSLHLGAEFAPKEEAAKEDF